MRRWIAYATVAGSLGSACVELRERPLEDVSSSVDQAVVDDAQIGGDTPSAAEAIDASDAPSLMDSPTLSDATEPNDMQNVGDALSAPLDLPDAQEVDALDVAQVDASDTGSVSDGVADSGFDVPFDDASDVPTDVGSDARDVGTSVDVDAGPRRITLEPTAFATLFNFDSNWNNARAATLADHVSSLTMRVAGYRSVATEEIVLERLVVHFPPADPGCDVEGATLELRMQFTAAALFAHVYPLPSVSGSVSPIEYGLARWTATQLGLPLSAYDPIEGTPRPREYLYSISVRAEEVADWHVPIVFGARSGQDVRDAPPSTSITSEEEFAFLPSFSRLVITCH